jgi:hypothetical protein
MKSVSEDIKLMLETLVQDLDLFPIGIGKEPEEPIDHITLFETSGYPHQLTFNRAEKYEYPSIQMRIRCYNYVDGYEQGDKIKDTLHGRGGETWNGTYYSLIACVNGPFLLDYDKNQNARFILNFNIQRR